METTLVTDIDPLKLGRFIDRKALFLQHWRFRKGGVSAGEWNHRVSVELEPMLSARLAMCCAQGVFAPKAVFAVVPAFSTGDSIVLLDNAVQSASAPAPFATFSFARNPEGRCIADFVRPQGSPEGPELTGWFAATLGPGVATYEAELRDKCLFEEYHLFHGLAVAMAEALAEEIHRQVRVKLGISQHDADTPTGIVRGGYQGRRYSFGYSCCPDLSQQQTLLDLLGADRIGIELTSGFQMVPEVSVTALVLASTEAVYFAG